MMLAWFVVGQGSMMRRVPGRSRKIRLTRRIWASMGYLFIH